MESDQSSTKPNQLLSQYVFHMESEIGCSKRTLHRIVSDYLRLRAQNPGLAQQVEELEIPSSEAMTEEQVELLSGKLRKLQSLRSKALQGMNSPAEHPWHGIAHWDLKPEEFESLLRTVRFVSIQLNKLWVESQSVPPFLNALDHATVSEMERIFRWLLSSPNWNELISQPRVIPFLAQGESRRVLLEFLRDIKSVRILRSKLDSKEDSRFLDSSLIHKGVELLTEGVNLVERYQLGTLTRSDLEETVGQIEAKLGRLEKIQNFFSRLSAQKRFPSENGAPRTATEARRVFFAATLLIKLPSRILSMRNGNVLAAGQLGKLEAWKSQVRGLLETRKRLEILFRLEESISSDELRKLAAELTSGGALRSFSTSYQGAVHRYQTLLKADLHKNAQKKKKETPIEMSSRLVEWASFLDHVRAFESQSDLRSVFGASFKGIDTEFELACQANAWISQFRADLKTERDLFSKSLVDYVVGSSESSVQSVVASLSDETAKEIEAYLRELDSPRDVEISEVCTRLSSELLDLRRLSNLLSRLGIQSEMQLNGLEELKTMTEEIVFLCHRMESNSDLKYWLKTAYRGADTDLSVIEQSLIYVQFIETAEIPDTLKSAFISGYGPQRLNESRNLVSSVWASLESLKELFQKLEICTHGQTKGFITYPVPVLLTRIQQALKQPALIHDWVEFIQCERDVRTEGLASLLDHYEKRIMIGWPLDQVFEFAYTASLLKVGIQDGNKNLLLSSVLSSFAAPLHRNPALPLQ